MIYEYKCEDCSHEFEKKVSVKEMIIMNYKIAECPMCKGKANKGISKTAISFKCECTPKFHSK